MSLVQNGSRVPGYLDPATQAKYRSICRKYGVDETTSWADVARKVQATRNQNTRRSDIIALRSILGRDGALRIPAPVRKVYTLPDPGEVRDRAAGPYEGYILAMAWAGLRIGEAVALQRSDVRTSGTQFWIEVTASRQNLGGRYKDPKSGAGRVFIPQWLHEVLAEFDYPEILPNSLYKWMKRRGLQPHGLRHLYCTMLVRTVTNVEMARRQMRHKSLTTTMGVYLEIEAQDEMGSIEALSDPRSALAQDEGSM